MKVTIFYGPERTGKTMVARTIIQLAGKEKTVWIRGRFLYGKNAQIPPRFFDECDENTELIVIDDCHTDMKLDFLRESVKNGFLCVDRKYGEPIYLYNVSVILTTNVDFQNWEECFDYVKFPIHILKEEVVV